MPSTDINTTGVVADLTERQQQQQQQRIATVIGHRPTAHNANEVDIVGLVSSQMHDNLIPVKLSCNPQTCPTTQVSLCLMHTRSVRNKTTDILDYIHEHNLDIVVLSETWFSNKDPDLRVIRDEILRHLLTD